MSRHAGDRNTTLFSYGFYGVNALERLVPGRVIKWLLPELDFNDPPTTPCTVSLCREIIEFMKVTPERFPKRTLVVAAAKGGFVPTNDNLEAAKFFGQMTKKRSEGEMSRCVKHDDMRHAWSRQDPELFARAVEAWVERAQVLTDEGFESLL
ncbi:MAG: hypothetical protein M1821_004828 [Bathelium mastoideum]|nr:MAG: hypothetical protein M1821_004828 [Bathelium mastoideum]